MELTEGIVEEIARGHTLMFRPRHRMTYDRDDSGQLVEARCRGYADDAPCDVEWRLKPDSFPALAQPEPAERYQCACGGAPSCGCALTNPPSYFGPDGQRYFTTRPEPAEEGNHQ